ncbi:MAG: hypothetical protein FWF28_09355, partial [Micrococcales bacterium]|nr:hypothetical protein [Micrococcales bacterium]
MSTVAAGQISTGSRMTIESTVASNWRGVYDLLVAGNGALADEAAQTGGLIEQNFTSLTGGGAISDAQIAAIEGLPGVEVAAPLSFIGQLDTSSFGLQFGADEPDQDASGFFASPRAFDVQMDVTVDDGTGRQSIARSTATVVTGSGDGGPVIGVYGSDDADALAGVGDGIWMANFQLPAVPALSTGLVAVDPQAEVQLLGSAAGFLRPLTQFATAQAMNAPGAELAAIMDPSAAAELKAARAAGAPADQLTSLVHAKNDFAFWNLNDAGPPTVVVPLVTSASAYPPLQATVTFTPVDLGSTPVTDLVDDTGTGLSDSGKALLSAAARGTPTSSTVNLNAGLTPLSIPNLNVALPGAQVPGGATADSNPSTVPQVAGRVEWTAPSAQQQVGAPAGAATDLVAAPQGRASLGIGHQLATEQTYRAQRIVNGQLPDQSTGNAVLYAPVSTYTPGEVTGTESSASYVPLGVYQNDAVTVSQPGAHQGAQLASSFSGLGAALASPGAITSLAAAKALTGRTGADVVRVRVAGITGYSPAALDKIGAVAQQIQAMGLDVRVVAGSSLGPVGVYLPQYFADGSDLGWTTQEWTSLGAAARVEQARLGATLVLLLVTLA